MLFAVKLLPVLLILLLFAMLKQINQLAIESVQMTIRRHLQIPLPMQELLLVEVVLSV